MVNTIACTQKRNCVLVWQLSVDVVHCIRCTVLSSLHAKSRAHLSDLFYFRRPGSSKNAKLYHLWAKAHIDDSYVTYLAFTLSQSLRTDWMKWFQNAEWTWMADMRFCRALCNMQMHVLRCVKQCIHVWWGKGFPEKWSKKAVALKLYSALLCGFCKEQALQGTRKQWKGTSRLAVCQKL